MKRLLFIIAAFTAVFSFPAAAQNSYEAPIYGVVTTPSGHSVKNPVYVNTNSCPTPVFDIPGNPLNCNSACAILAVRDSMNLSPPGTMTPGWTWTIKNIDNNMCSNARVELWSSGVIRAAIGNNGIGTTCTGPGCTYLGSWAAWWGNCTPGNSYTIIQDHQSPTATTEIRMYYPTSNASFNWEMRDDFTNAIAVSGIFDFSTVTTQSVTTGVQSYTTGINQGTAKFTCPTCPGASFTDGKNGFAQFCPAQATPGKYACTYSFTAGTCSNSYTDTIRVNSINNATWTSPGTVCANATYNLTSYLSGSATSGGTWTGTSISGSNFTPTTAGSVAITYSVGTAACKVAETHTIAVLASPTVSVTPPGPNTYCAGTPVNLLLTASGASSYVWSTAETTSAITVSPGVSTTYTVVGTSLQGCNTTTTVPVNFTPLPVLSVSTQTVSCAGGTGSASVAVSSGTSPFTYVWSNGTSASAITAAAGTYSISVTDAAGCTGTQTASIAQPAAITVSVSSTGASCGQSNGTVTSSIGGGTTPYTYNWTGGGTASSVTGLAAGSYSLVVTDGNGCTNSTSAVVATLNGPTAVITTNTTIVSGNSASLTATGGATYSWTPTAGLSCTTCANPLAHPTATTLYCVTVKDANGCSDSACIKIYVDDKCKEFSIPNVFSPNGDNKNDKFRPLPVGCFKDMNFSIYNRWGNLMFSTTDQLTQGWDGNSEDGKECSDGVYFYTLKATFVDGTAIDKSGTVTLMK